MTIVSGKQWPDATERLLRDLPEWFGIEQSILNYVDAARALPSTAALRNDEVVGVCLVRRHTSVAAEIELLAVQRGMHRQGIGRRLVRAVEDDLRETGVVLLQVKTFGPSGTSEESVGFLPLEERNDIWGPENPCLISVKPLR